MKMHAGFRLCCTLFLGLVVSSSLVRPAVSEDADDSAAAGKTSESAGPDTQSVTNSSAENHVAVTPATIEQLRREIEQSAARNAEAITASLSVIEPTLRQMQERQ